MEIKLLLLTHRALSGHAPEYMEQFVSRRQPVRSLRSSEHKLVCVPRTRRHWGESIQRGSPKSVERSTTAPDLLKLKLMTYFQKVFVQRCEQRMLEQRYINVTIMIMIIISTGFEGLKTNVLVGNTPHGVGHYC